MSPFFCEANDIEVDQILQVLRNYEEASGQMVNLDKTGLFFLPGTPLRERRQIMTKFGVSESRNMEKYLGLPVNVGRSKKKVFVHLVHKV